MVINFSALQNVMSPVHLKMVAHITTHVHAVT